MPPNRWFIVIIITVFFHKRILSYSYIVTQLIESQLCVNITLGAVITAVNKTVVVSALVEFTFEQENHVTKLIT